MTSARNQTVQDRRALRGSGGGRLLQLLVAGVVLAAVMFAQAQAEAPGRGEPEARAFAAALDGQDVAALGRLLDDGVVLSGADSRGRSLRMTGETPAIHYLDAWRLSGEPTRDGAQVRMDGADGARVWARVSYAGRGPTDGLRLEIRDGRVVRVEVGPGPVQHAELDGR